MHYLCTSTSSELLLDRDASYNVSSSLGGFDIEHNRTVA